MIEKPCVNWAPDPSASCCQSFWLFMAWFASSAGSHTMFTRMTPNIRLFGRWALRWIPRIPQIGPELHEMLTKHLPEDTEVYRSMLLIGNLILLARQARFPLISLGINFRRSTEASATECDAYLPSVRYLSCGLGWDLCQQILVGVRFNQVVTRDLWR
jgi:hypothetical protein